MVHILLFGAAPSMVAQYRTCFEKAGVALVSAEIGDSFEELIRRSKPAAILLDVSRTGQEGEDLVRWIRFQPEFKMLQVFALTDQPIHAENNDSAALEGVTRSFQNLPALIPEVVKAVSAAVAVQSAPVNTEEGPVSSSALPASSMDDGSSLLPPLKDAFRQFCSAENGTRLELLTRMQEQVRNLRRAFLASDSPAITAFSSALVKLFMTLSKDLARVNPSSLRTLSTAIDVLSLSAGSRRKDVENGLVRVLIVDGEPLSRHALQFALSSPDLELSECDSLESALQYLRRQQYDVVFADFKMVRSGEFSTQVQKLPSASNIPIVIVTSGSPEFEVRVQSALSGGCDLISKPFTPSEMVLKAFTAAFQRRLGLTPSLSQAAGNGRDSAHAIPAQRSRFVSMNLAVASQPKSFSAAATTPEFARQHAVAVAAGSAGREEVLAIMDAGEPSGPDDQIGGSAQVSGIRTFEQSSPTDQMSKAPVMNEISETPPRSVPGQPHELNGSDEKRSPEPSDAQPPVEGIGEQLRQKFEEVAACRVLTDELTRVRSVLQAERSRRQEAEKAAADSVTSQEDLAGKLENARQREAAQKDLVHSLQSKLDEATTKLSAVEASLQAQTRECRRLQVRSKDFEEQVGDLTGQLGNQVAMEESRRRREAELEACVLNQQAEIAKAKAAVAVDEANVRRARDRMQSTLRMVLEELQGSV